MEPPGPASIAALRDALLNGREPPPVEMVARLPSFRWWVVGTVCIGAFMGQVDSSVAQMLLPTLEREFGARLSTVSWVAVGYLLAMAASLALFRHGVFVTGNIAGLLSYAALFGLMFLLPFVFVRVYGDSALAAGLRLSIVPVTLGVIAPIGGALSDWLGSRTVTSAGMLICVAGLGLLFTVLDGTAASLPPTMLALAIFGAGQGLFISPNNSALMGAAPPRLTGEAGGLLNVMRSLGISVGIAAASSLLSWRLAVLTGSGHGTLQAQAHHLVSAGGAVILLLGGFTAAAGALSLLQGSSRASERHEASG